MKIETKSFDEGTVNKMWDQGRFKSLNKISTTSYDKSTDNDQWRQINQ